MRINHSWLVVISLLSGSYASTIATGSTVSVNNVPIFLPPLPVANIRIPKKLKSCLRTTPFVPFTVFSGVDGGDVAALSAQISNFTAKDDVWNSGFLDAVYVHHLKPKNQPHKPTRLTLKGHDFETITIGPLKGSRILPPGPYFVNKAGQVFEAWRLYSDTNGAFTESIIENSNLPGSYDVLPAGIPGQRLAIAVPSKLYFTKTKSKPLAGVRIGIKDIFDIKGLRTSNGNRAWYKLYPPANYTATPVQNLISAGAILVGKMITSQFANGESFTADWVDYHESFNPRGDGYQDTSSSSSGGGAGAAAYAWLDVALGSDTGGSVRGPAQVQGVYGNRPSHGIVPLKHTMSLSPTLDTPGLLARDPIIWKEVAKAMYGKNLILSKNYPKKLKVLGWPTTRDSVPDKLLVDFLKKVTEFLEVKPEPFNLIEQWRKDNPKRAPLESLLNITYAIIISQEQVPLVRDPFYRDYAAKHDGRRPFVDPVPLVRWEYGLNSGATLQEARANKTAFMSWFNSTVLPPNEETCSESILIYVGGKGKTQYRNTYLNDPIPPFGFDEVGISVFSEAPDFVVPIGEAPYYSTITQHEEFLPVSVDFMAAQGCDGILFSLIEDLHKAGIVKTALAGRSGISGGELFSRGK